MNMPALPNLVQPEGPLHAAPPPPGPMSTNPIPVVFVPYQKYSQKELNHQLDLSAADIQLLTLMHSFDRGGPRACFARDIRLADELGTTEGAIRSRVSRLRKKGYVVTIGYERHGIANRRVVLKYGVKTDARGSYTDTVVNGRPQRKKRKTGEANPIIFLRDAVSPPLASMRGHPSQDAARQSVFDSDNKNSPISASGPAGPEAELPDFIFSQPDSLTPSAGTPHSRQESVASETTAPDVTTPATMTDLDGNPGRRGKPWQELAHRHPGFRAICQRFGVDVTTTDKATARSFMKRIQNHGNTFNTHSIRFVLNNLEELRVLPDAPVKTPKSMAEFLRDFNPLAGCLLRESIHVVKDRIQLKLDSFRPGNLFISPALKQFKELQDRHQFETFDAFYAYRDTATTISLPDSHHYFAWVAALHFIGLGERSVLENGEAQVTVIEQIITHPELLNNLPGPLVEATGLTAQQLVDLRSAVLAQLKRCQSLYNANTSLERTLALHTALPSWIEQQIADYLDGQSLEEFVDVRMGLST